MEDQPKMTCGED